MTLPSWLTEHERTAHLHHRPAHPGRTGEWPSWVSSRVRQAFGRRGIDAPWAHQVAAAEAAHAGRHVALATGTASGKSLAYLLPVLAACVDGRAPASARVAGGRGAASGLRLSTRPTALYLAPTKALAHDQLRACAELGVAEWRVSTLDGDSDPDERRFAREFASYVLTNPDMLHRSILPNHTRYARLLGGLTHVVVDEAHRYKGVFGAHVAAVLRRLRRLAHHYGASPTFVCASATIAEPDAVASALIGSDDVLAITEDGSPHPALDVLLLEPTPSLTDTTARLLAAFAAEGQALAFTTSRLQAELVALRAQQRSEAPHTIAAYRGGYLPGDRRSIEAALSSGRLRGVASTSALELGIDIAGMDAVVTAGFPGTLAAFWQQVGRAGRAGRDAVAVLVAREDPLDAYLVAHPELVFDRPVERTVVPTDNPFVLGPHLCAAAQEQPLTDADEAWFGPQLRPLADALTRQGALRRRPLGWFWTHPSRAVDAIDLRSAQGKAIEVVDEATGRVIGQVEPSACDRTVHPEAVYVHQGETWVVTDVDPADRIALVRRDDPPYFTQPQSVAGVRILTTEQSRPLGLGTVHVGSVELSTQVVSYLRRDAETGEVWDSTPLEFPERRLSTRASWWTLPDTVIAGLGVDLADLAGAVHGAEHCAIGLLPLFVPCDRWDIGGVSTVLHPDTGEATVFVHDGLPGGSGIADRGFGLAERWWGATLERLLTCPCDTGCPACVVSPKCGSGNNPLDKSGAAALLTALIPAPP
ncbi:MAG: DEAD/DEAH box helicase [Actinomycetes bacterium]